MYGKYINGHRHHSMWILIKVKISHSDISSSFAMNYNHDIFVPLVIFCFVTSSGKNMTPKLK
jgi:hypothetical protein